GRVVYCFTGNILLAFTISQLHHSADLLQHRAQGIQVKVLPISWRESERYLVHDAQILALSAPACQCKCSLSHSAVSLRLIEG
ncbi:MAG: hypothetical protein RJA41_695, partial [Actinomycetota bacterium]